jgi:hypothetical protein
MNRKQKMLLLATSMAIAFFAMTVVTASPRIADTPLYIFRMERASDEMNFSPTGANTFTYIAENGHDVAYVPEHIDGESSPEACTYGGRTCDETCAYTCSYTCVDTCSTCVSTCANTCANTCDDPTCGSTCKDTCSNTCVNTCHTCVSTCGFTCMYTCEGTCDASCQS